jgi:hypothetical protein
MDLTTIVLGIIVLVLIYLLYVFFVQNKTTLVQTADLKTTNPPISTLASGTSTRYAYGIWIYINTWSNGQKVIFQRDGNVKLYLDNTTPTLYADITVVSANGGSPTPNQIKLTDNFPVQKWVYVILSCDNTTIDCYLDGKLVNSVLLPSFPNSPGTPANAPMKLGQGFDAYVSGFQSWGSPLGPQEAWDSYMSGNGTSSVSRFFSSYAVNVSVSKDNVEQNKYRIF